MIPSREITIVSITKNDYNGIRRTVESIFRQEFIKWRLVVVVSSDRDSSLEYVKKLSETHENIDYLIPDSLGIYQAMNFALDRFKPELTWFLNGGDIFRNEFVLSKSIALIEKNSPSVLIGGYEIIENEKKRQFLRPARQISPRLFSLNVRSGNHQAMLFDFSGRQELRFNLDLKLASDFLLVLEILRIKPGLRTSDIFVEIEPNGVSDLLIEKVWIEKQNAREIIFGRNSVDFLLGKLWTIAVRAKKSLRNLWKGNHLKQ